MLKTLIQIMGRETLQISEANQFFDYFKEELPYRDVLDLLLLLLKQRPACLVMNTDSEEVEKLQEFCETFNFNYRIEEGQSKLSGNSVFISREKNRLEMLEKADGRFCGFTDVQVGRFLGFPEEDAKYFSKHIENGQIEPEVRKKSEKLIEEDMISREEFKYVEITSYVPKPVSENILQCIEKGKEHEKAVKDFDKKYGTELGEQVLQLFLQNY